MHELSVCRSIIEQVEAVAAERGGRVRNVRVQVGPLSGVEPRLLERAFPLAREGSVAADAELTVETVPIRVHCVACGEDSDAAMNDLRCRHCGRWRTCLVSGDELILSAVEMADEAVPDVS